jgi:peptide/nickel transport system substrate-binding protein
MKKIKLLLCLFMLTTLCGCSNSNKNESSKTLNAAMFWISTSLDPTNNYDGWVLSRIGVGETLLKLNEKYEVEPYLAKSYEQIDDTTWKLTLKDSITFSNGKKVTGENVKSCLERAFEKNTRAIDYFDLNHVEAKGQDIYLYLNKSSGAILNNLCEPLFTIYDASQSEEDIVPALLWWMILFQKKQSIQAKIKNITMVKQNLIMFILVKWQILMHVF